MFEMYELAIYLEYKIKAIKEKEMQENKIIDTYYDAFLETLEIILQRIENGKFNKEEEE